MSIEQWRARGLFLVFCFLFVAVGGVLLEEDVVVLMSLGFGAFAAFMVWRNWEG